MPTLTIKLTNTQSAFVDSEARRRGLERDDFLSSLVEREQLLSNNERLDQLLLDGLASESREITAEEWTDIRREALGAP